MFYKLNVRKKAVVYEPFSISSQTLILILFFIFALIPAAIVLIMRAKRDYDDHDREF